MKQEEKHTDEEARGSASSGRKMPLPWMVFAGVLLIAAVAAGVYWNSTVKVTQVEFTGNYFVSAEELQQVEVPLGLNPDSMNFVKIINEFEQIPFVKQADMNVAPGGRLSVHITERQPVAMLTDGNDKIYVDGEGLRLPLILGKQVDVPILYGFRARPVGDTLSSDKFQKVGAFLKELQNRPVSNATISEVAWTESDGVVALTNQNGVKLTFGFGDFATRMRNWEAFYAEVIKEKGIENMRTIDLRFEGQIVARER